MLYGYLNINHMYIYTYIYKLNSNKFTVAEYILVGFGNIFLHIETWVERKAMIDAKKFGEQTHVFAWLQAPYSYHL